MFGRATITLDIGPHSSLRTVSDIINFNNKLKTHLFKFAFDIQVDAFMNFPHNLSSYFIVHPCVLAFSVIHLDQAYCNGPAFLQLVCNMRTINVC